MLVLDYCVVGLKKFSNQVLFSLTCRQLLVSFNRSISSTCSKMLVSFEVYRKICLCQRMGAH